MIHLAQANLGDSKQVVEGAQQEVVEKNNLLDVAKSRVQTLLKELSEAKKDLLSVKKAAQKAATAAKNADANANSRRYSRNPHESRKIKQKRIFPRKHKYRTGYLDLLQRNYKNR